MLDVESLMRKGNGLGSVVALRRHEKVEGKKGRLVELSRIEVDGLFFPTATAAMNGLERDGLVSAR